MRNLLFTAKLLTAIALTCTINTLCADPLTVINAASQQAVHIAPGSIVTIYGTNLASGVSISPSALTPPTTLGGTTVTIGGSAATLFFVSPGQINAVVNAATPVGTETVVVTSSTGNQQGSVVIDANAPPGIFSLNGIGSGDGAFVNALTALLGPFTPGSNHSTTFLELFATGLNLSFTPTVTIGGVSATVQFFGASPCCAGLQQINIVVPVSLAGAGRVPVVVSDNGQSSNTVEVVLLPAGADKPFAGDQDDQPRSRELSSLAWVPGTSLVLSADENDDVIRVIDVSARNVVRVIALSDGAAPEGIAVNAAGTLAVVTERGLGKVAMVSLTTSTVVAEVATGVGAAPINTAIAGTLAVVANRDTNSVTIIDLTTNKIVKTIAVGRAPRAVAVDAAGAKAYITNENDGTISVVDLVGLTVTKTLTVRASARLEAIAILPAAGIAFVAAPASNEVFLVNIATGDLTSIAANPAGSGGSTDVAVLNSKIYFANQTGGSVSVLPVNPTTGVASGPITTIKVDLGARALAIDSKDNLLVVSNEGTGTIVLIDLTSGSIVGRVNAVKSNNSGDDGGDDHSDHDGASNLPSISSVSPVAGKAKTTFTMTIAGSSLAGATNVLFVSAASIHGDSHGNSRNNNPDTAFTATNILVNAAGTQLTATITVSAAATAGPRIVSVVTRNGQSAAQASSADTFTVTP
jgi:uncharacterized protein (TIGR03437 family)